MFLDSVWGGFVSLAHWQVLLSLAIFEAAWFAFLYSMGTVIGRGESGGRATLGCLSYMLIGPLLQGVLLSLLVAFLLPIMLGGSHALPLGFLVRYFRLIAIAGVAGTILGIVISFAPIIGAFISESVGIQTFITGVVAFRIIAGDDISEVLKKTGHPSADVYPSIWLTLGYLAISSVLVMGAMWLMAYLQTKTMRDTSASTLVVAPLLAIVAGVLPLFMYAQYVVMSIRALILP